VLDARRVEENEEKEEERKTGGMEITTEYETI
jgi:hypothetical protein